LRQRRSDGGIVERPFGSINSEFLSTLPGHTTSRLKGHRTQVETEACVTLEDLESLLVRYIYLAGYAGESVVLRYNPRDISTLLIYRQQGAKDVFLTRAHAQYLDTEKLTLVEAKAISQKLREVSKEITNRSVLKEISDRNRFVENLLKEKLTVSVRPADKNLLATKIEEVVEEDFDFKTLPKIKVYDYEQLRQNHGL
jgi:putative transposase